ncbi:MAG: insulinase family protein, partial [Lachnospiraceae bacterium]|nr:insulinase family protein [Lachnospiraceae bacterium]
TPEYIANFDADERDMTKYIIGTISGMDTPLTPSQNGLRSLGAYMTGVPIELLEKERNQVIDATVEDIRALAPAVEKALEQNYICVVGNEDAIQKNKELFQTTAPLI